VDHQLLAAGQVVEQLLDQSEVGAVAVFVGLVYVGRVTDQAPEHHPHAEQVGVHDPWRKRRAEERIQARGGAFDPFDLCPQRAGQLIGQLVVGLGYQCVDAAEVVVEQAHRHAGLGGNPAHRNPGVAVAGKAGEGGGNQQVAAFVRVGTAQFCRGCGHGNALEERPEGSG